MDLWLHFGTWVHNPISVGFGAICTANFGIHEKKLVYINLLFLSQPVNSANVETGTQESINTERDIEFIIPMKVEAQSQPLDKDR